MSQAGIGAMLFALGGGSQIDPKTLYGKKIAEAMIDDKELRLKFEDGTSVSLWDDGQSCCESRYMTTDDNVQDLVGGVLVNIEAKSHSNTERGEYDDVHEQVFVEVRTDRAFVTLVNHNQHNGYYGGFGLTITTTPKGR